MASSLDQALDSIKRLQQDRLASMQLAAVRALTFELREVCKSGDLSLKTLQEIIRRFPQSSIEMLRDNGHAWFSDEGTPLHAACRNKKVDVNIIQALLEFWRESASLRSGCGQYPTHILCDNTVLQDADSLEILKLLAEASPESLWNEDNHENLPIHIAAMSKPRDFCEILVGAYPESVRIPTTVGNLPIHCACRGRVYTCEENRCLDTVKYLLDLAPESIHARNNGGDLPIHLAAMCSDESEQNEHADIIQFLLDQDPTCASMATDDEYQYLPLHCACDGRILNLKVVVIVIKILFDSYPDALSTTTENGSGDTPLGLIGRNVGEDARVGPNQSMVINFLETQLEYAQQAQDSDIMTSTDDNGWLPLHRAIQAYASLGSIKLLVNGNEDAMRVAGVVCGSFPLHIACEFCTVDVVKFLVDRYDGCLNQCDNDGNSPLHRACLGGNSSVVRYLVERHGTSVSSYNANKKLPIHLLVESDKVCHESLAYQEALFILLRAHPEAIVSY